MMRATFWRHADERVAIPIDVQYVWSDAARRYSDDTERRTCHANFTKFCADG